MLRLLSCILMVLALCCSAGGQTFDLEKDRVPVVSLAGLWRFHTGDDPRWSDPQFDDSAWPLLRSNQWWTQQGYADYKSVAWYRVRVVVPPSMQGPLTFRRPDVHYSFELFADGKQIASCGSMPPHPTATFCPDRIVALPGGESKGFLTLAFRVWTPSAYVGGLAGTSQIGTTAAMSFYERGEHDDLQVSATTDEFMFLFQLLSLFSLRLCF